MNDWVLERAGPRAQALQAKLSECEAAIAAARAGAEVERLHSLAPQRVEIGSELTALLRPIRERHRAELRALFFSRVGNTTSTQTYRLRCQAVEAGLGWATATEVLDSALLAWKKSLALGRVADKDRWSLQLVLRLAEPIRIEHTPLSDLAAVHFGWTRCEGGRRVATVARSADPGAAQPVVLPASIEGDLHHSAELQGRRALARDALLPHLATLANAKRQLPPALRAELEALAKLPVNHVAFGRIYRLHKALAGIGLWRDWFDAWIRDDRMHWQAAVLLARRARGRRRDFYRYTALQIARDHRAVVMEPLDLRAASKAVDEASGQWAAFSRHARAGRVVVALHEFEHALRWACARHDTPVFELKGMTTRTCATCGAIGLAAAQDARQQVLCVQCGAEHDRHVNAACCAWRWTHDGLDCRVQVHRNQAAGLLEQTKARVEARKLGIADKRRASRAASIACKQGGEPEGPS